MQGTMSENIPRTADADADADAGKRPRRVTPTAVAIAEEKNDENSGGACACANANANARDDADVDDESRPRRRPKRAEDDDAPKPGPRTTTSSSPEDAFVTRLRRFHRLKLRASSFRVPYFCHSPLDLREVFEEVRARGGYHAVTTQKRWLEVCRTLGKDLSGQTSAGFQMRVNYQKMLLAYEIHLESRGGEDGEDADADDDFDDDDFGGDDDGGMTTYEATIARIAAAAEAAARFRGGGGGGGGRRARRGMEFRGGPSRGGGGGGGGKKTYKATDEEETEIAFELGLYTYANDDEKRFLPERYDEGAYLVIRNMILARWRADPSAYVSVEHACGFVMDKWKPLVHAAHRFLTSRGYINFGVGFATNYLTPGSAKGTCVVVGAGLAGLAAARQLMSFGHRVVVVEGRDRPGGRAWTTKLSGTDPKTGEVKTAVGEMGGRRVLSHTGPHTTAFAW